MGREVELKFDLGPGAADAVRAHPLLAVDQTATPGVQRLQAVYFDTEDQALRRAGLSLRIRDEGSGRVQTLKSDGGQEGLFARGEWETPLESDTPDLDHLADTPFAPMLNALTTELRPVFESRIDRLTRTIHSDGSDVELSLDQGEVVTPDRRAPLDQLEIELKRGPVAGLFDVARTLAQAAPLSLSFQTKANAGYRLLDAPGDPSLKADAPKLAGDASAARAFQAIARTCLLQLTGNQSVLRETRSSEALHQMRIALRRLRAAISAFGPIVADDRVAEVRADLKWLAGELNTARNLDVFLEETVATAEEGPAPIEGLKDLQEELRNARTVAYDRALAATGGDRYRSALLETAAWVESGAWIESAEASGAKMRETPAMRFAAIALDRRRRGLRKRGKALAHMHPEDRHELRIAAKKMRYAAEFFAPLFEGRKASKRKHRFVAALKELQDCLGKLNDIATGPETVASVLLTGREPARRARAIFAAGRLVGARAADEPQLIKASERAFAAFAEAKPFW